jgi:hypothetical protein
MTVNYKMAIYQKAEDPKKPGPTPPFSGTLTVFGASALPRVGDLIKFVNYPHTYHVLDVSHELPLPRGEIVDNPWFPVVGIELFREWG